MDRFRLAVRRVTITSALAVICGTGACRAGFDARFGADAPPSSNDAIDGSSDGGASYYTIGGTASGLTGTGLVLRDNGGDDLAVDADGGFVFATPIADGASYAVTVGVQPSGVSCSVASASGTVAGHSVSDVAVTCFAAGACPTTQTFTTNGTFALPTGCTAMTVYASGGGGAGGAKNMGTAAAPGGRGGLAVASFTGLAANSTYVFAIGQGGTCGSTVATAGGFIGGAGGNAGGSGNGGVGAGSTSPPGGIGGVGSTGAQPGGAGGNGGYGGGGGGGGGDTAKGNSAGGATRFQKMSPLTDYVIAGGGGGAGAADQNGDVAGAGGAACTGYNGVAGGAASAGNRSGGGGGGGACTCLGGACNAAPTSAGGAAGVAGAATSGCTGAQNGTAGQIVITFP